jgi:hypothetical protein
MSDIIANQKAAILDYSTYLSFGTRGLTKSSKFPKKSENIGCPIPEAMAPSVPKII